MITPLSCWPSTRSGTVFPVYLTVSVLRQSPPPYLVVEFIFMHCPSSGFRCFSAPCIYLRQNGFKFLPATPTPIFCNNDGRRRPRMAYGIHTGCRIRVCRARLDIDPRSIHPSLTTSEGRAYSTIGSGSGSCLPLVCR